MSDRPQQSTPPESPVLAEVGDRFGIIPNFFRITPEAPEVTENLWGFAKFGYLDNPLPPLFKERLFIYLSRFCDVRYCIARHVGFLVGLGRPAGDPHVDSETIEQAVNLIRAPLPRDEQLAPLIKQLNDVKTPLLQLPESGTPLETAIFACASHVFLQTRDAAACLEALRRVLDGRTLQYLLALLAFVRTAHFWTSVHPELRLEDDIAQLLDVHEALAECVLRTLDAEASDATQTLLNEVAELRQEKEQAELVRVTLASIGDAVISTDEHGNVEYLNAVAEKLTGWTQPEAVGQPIESVFNIVNERTGEKIASPVADVLRLGEAVGLANDTMLIHRDGSRRAIEDSCSPMLVGNHVVGVVLVFRDVTRRRQQKRELEEQERQFRTLANSITQLAWMANPDGYIFWYNSRWFEYTGTTMDQMQGWGWETVHDPEVLPSVLAGWKKAIAEGEIFEMVFPLKGSDGIFRQFLTRVHPVKDEDGNVVRWFGTNTDIDEVKRVEDELVDARSRLDSILAAAEVGTWEYDIASDTVSADRNLASIFGMDQSQAHQASLASFLQLIHPDDRETVSASFEQSLQTGVNFAAEFRILGADERLRWVVARGRVDNNNLGQAWRLPGVMIDITARKQFENEVIRLASESERQRRLYQTVLSNTADSNYTFDLDGRFTYVNQALLSLWQLEEAEALGKNFFDLDYPPELAEKLHRQIEEVIRTRRPLKDETPYTAHAEERLYEYIFVPVIGVTGSVEAVAGSTRDITERKLAEEAMRQADRRKDEFLATLAHELRNPLSPIASAIAVIQDCADDPEEIRQLAEIADRQTRQLVRLVEDLLDVSRISLGKIQLQRSIVPLSETIQQAQETISSLIEESGHELTIETPAEGVFVDGDPVRLNQIVTNLLSNAAKYTPSGGQIDVRLTTTGNHAQIEVVDNGVGIPVERLSDVFELFTQLSIPGAPKNVGLGLGLALVQQLTALHGGTIKIHSAGPGNGTHVTVRLPLSDPPEPGEEVAPPISRHVQRRVLVVDDLRAITVTLSRLLERMGHQVISANEGSAALEMIDDFQPDVIFSDISMPEMDGYELAAEIRKRHGQSIRLVALTGYGMQSDQERASIAGFDHHMVKPPDVQTLKQFLDSLP